MLVGLAAAGAFLVVAPGAPTQGNVLAAILVVLFGFFFATVSSRITGLIGIVVQPDLGDDDRDADPDLHHLRRAGLDGRHLRADRARRRRHRLHRRRERGTTSQDLKTGYIVGATPVYQQIGLIIGVVTSAFVIGITTLYLHDVLASGRLACRRRRRR